MTLAGKATTMQVALVAERSKALRSGRSLLCGRRFESCPVHHFAKANPYQVFASVAQLVERSAVNR